MDQTRRRSATLAFVVCVGLLHPLDAAEPPPRGRDVPPPSLPGSPTTDLNHSPVTQFRAWLALDAAGIENALAARPEPVRRFLAARVRDYAALPVAERESRLRLMQLHWEATVLLTADRTNRVSLLRQLDDEHRAALEPRLLQWDTLPPALQQDLLRNEAALQAFLRLEDAPKAAPPARPTTPPAPAGTANSPLERELARWQGLTQDRQLKLHQGFLRFFEMDPAARATALAALPATERSDMERSVAVLARLSAAERAQCLDSLRRLASMSSSERADFLRNAERWRAMSPEDQAAWRRIAPQLPPAPPGLATRAPSPTPAAAATANR